MTQKCLQIRTSLSLYLPFSLSHLSPLVPDSCRLSFFSFSFHTFNHNPHHHVFDPPTSACRSITSSSYYLTLTKSLTHRITSTQSRLKLLLLKLETTFSSTDQCHKLNFLDNLTGNNFGNLKLAWVCLPLTMLSTLSFTSVSLNWCNCTSG